MCKYYHLLTPYHTPPSPHTHARPHALCVIYRCIEGRGISIEGAVINMKRHLCRHYGFVLDRYAELQGHVKSHATPSLDEHTCSVVPQAVVPCSYLSKRAKYVCEKCGVTFGILDNLQHHIRTVCSRNCLSIRSSSCSRSSNRKKHHHIHV